MTLDIKADGIMARQKDDNPQQWDIYRVTDGKRADAPIATLNSTGDNEWTVTHPDEPDKAMTELKGTFEEVILRIEGTVAKALGNDDEHNEFASFFVGSMRNMNILASNRNQMGAFLQALATTLADTLVEDVKPGGVGSVLGSFSKQVRQRMRERNVKTIVLSEVRGLIEGLIKHIEEAKVEPEADAPKH